MSKSNKIIIGLSVVAFLLLSVLVSLVAVYAYDEEDSTRNINVTCNAIDANVMMFSNYKYGDKETEEYSSAVSMTIDGKENTERISSLVATNNKVSNTLKPLNNIVLTEQNNSVIFEFTIVNEGDKACSATLTIDDEVNKNCVVEYSLDGENWGGNLKVNVSAHDGTFAGISNYYVRISLVDVQETYSYSSNFIWTIVGKYF